MKQAKPGLKASLVKQALRVLWALTGRLERRVRQVHKVPPVLRDPQVNKALMEQLAKQDRKAQRERRVILAKQVLRVTQARPGRQVTEVILDPQGRVALPAKRD